MEASSGGISICRNPGVSLEGIREIPETGRPHALLETKKKKRVAELIARLMGPFIFMIIGKIRSKSFYVLKIHHETGFYKRGREKKIKSLTLFNQTRYGVFLSRHRSQYQRRLPSGYWGVQNHPENDRQAGKIHGEFH